MIMPSTSGQVISFVNKSNHLLFSQLADYMKQLEVKLPPQLMSCIPRQGHPNKKLNSSQRPRFSNNKRKRNSIDLNNQYVASYTSYITVIIIFNT